MIIGREYVTFKELILREDKGGKLFTKLCKKSYPPDMWEKAYIMLSDYALYQRDMGWAFCKIRELIEGFEKLDKEEPYETGYEMCDARSADILWCNENEIKLLLRTGTPEEGHVVGIIKVQVSAVDKHPIIP